MPIQLIDNIGAVGIVADVDVHKLPDGAWSDVLNMRFDGFTASKVLGTRTVQGSLSAVAYSIFPHTTFNGDKFFAYAGLTSVHTVNNNIHYDITRLVGGAYTTDANELWTGGVLGGLLFMNNGQDIPQVQLTPTASCHLSNLPNWPTTITTRCSSLRAFRNFLIALDVTKGVQRYRQMVKWSASADPLTVPGTWDEGDPTNDAGENSLSDTDGNVIDCLPLGDVNIVYKDDSIYGMQYIGGQFIFRFYQIFKDVGILAKRCVAAYEKFHLFIGNDLDVYVHDGNSVKSVAQDRVRQFLRSNITSSNYTRAFVVRNPATTEIWVCIPTTDGYSTLALMWNWRKDVWSFRELPNTSGGAVGGIESSDYITQWDALSVIDTTWAQWGVTWAQLEGLPPDQKLVLVSPTVTAGLIETEYGGTELGQPLNGFVERQGLWALPSKVVDGGRIVDVQGVKFIRRVRFRCISNADPASVTFSVAVQNDLDSPLVWQTKVAMTDKTVEMTPFKRGRFISYRIESNDDSIFAVENISIEYDPAGDYL